MKLNTASAPHLKTKDSTRKIMIDVLIALVPAVVFSTWVFGIRALFIMLSSMVIAEVLDYSIIRFFRQKKDYIPDFSAAVTGLLLGMNLTMAVTWYHILIGVIFSIVIAKHAFGGIGQNIFNPALIGRIFLLVSFPTAMTTWHQPFYYKMADATTTATALGVLKEETFSAAIDEFSYLSMFIGTIPGSIGEISALLLLVGFIYLLIRGRIKWIIPLTYIGTVFLISSIGYFITPSTATPLFHILSGGLMLGALFMATDMVTSPMTKWGQLIFGLGLGTITMVIRYFGAYPEGVSYSIVIMNALVPLIDKFGKPVVFGTTKGVNK